MDDKNKKDYPQDTPTKAPGDGDVSSDLNDDQIPSPGTGTMKGVGE